MSPFRRAIETACHALANHPLKEMLILKLTPDVKEIMSYQNTLLVSKSFLLEFTKQMADRFSLRFDCTAIEQYGEYWFWESHPNRDVAQSLLKLTNGD